MHPQRLPSSGGPIRAVIFDFGGVLTRSDATDDLLARCDAQLGLSPGTLRLTLHSGQWWEGVSTGQISEKVYWAKTGAVYEERLPPEFDHADWKMVGRPGGRKHISMEVALQSSRETD